MLFGGSDRVRGNNGPTEVDTHLRMPTVWTIVANTYSLLVIVPDVPLRSRGDRTRKNNTRAAIRQSRCSEDRNMGG